MSMNPRALGRRDGGGSISHFFLAIDPKANGQLLVHLFRGQNTLFCEL